MRKDSRLSRMLHVLIHMQQFGEPVTSETLAAMLSTNPVVVRRTMRSLKEQGYVHSVKGHGGGWTLTVPLSSITLLDIYRALGESTMFTIGLTDEHSRCPIEKAVNNALGDVLAEAEKLVIERFENVALDALAEEFSNHHVEQCRQ
ncbi:Rrf2 family transcriptional regulator [Exilibacterium tricleocarpae]|uniref:Rrf2 family transcriptional regulator n=1 Tax=Exilibacterium tricleocarpae TaxID=2591008 RepID=A0A545TAD1_9GAMM|nr:Rrf2 family transcriptional regulator [Exilibacterium tricleocarpae]TQV74168.1 Rrf2 family transcriptional regulator [Exilibacterium tricleocarpae]